jgi:hypothetical protein
MFVLDLLRTVNQFQYVVTVKYFSVTYAAPEYF